MAILYGVLRGRPDRFKREDNASTPHLQIRVLEDGGQPWRIAVNVQSNTGSHVAFWVVDPLVGHPVLASLEGRSQGFTTLAANAGGALDYVKAPLFDLALGRVLPPTGAASADDLQDLLSLFLEQCKAAGGEIFAFGAKFEQNLHKPIDMEFGNTDGLHGIHDIHMNQGNVGQHAGDNGVFHDGGLILKFPDRLMGLFLAFQSQRVPTDAAGNAATGALAIEQILGGGGPTLPPPLVSTIYIERALINPSGADPGLETVVLGNLAATSQTLSHWRLLDKNGRATPIDATLAPGASLIVALDGRGVQLGNNGGNLILQDDTNAQVDVVTYTAEDAGSDNRYVRFRR
ncbi:hypothetical protein LuPra_01166 [Luteitalea pratensis]|uniref:LTD domain-containing protein n=1 Tax=Luteitalea pratensis TaxID=1855912 RepID=A0A143PIR8_LUTPR|nr:DUF2278 family protein [Luteitalea pratensis]AMY07978.1 hypothetical protein LuPra_01166 [Luteitalea pratensis]